MKNSVGKYVSQIKFDLGLRQLFPEWKALFSFRGLKEDFIAGVTVACIAVPLSLAIALASGAEPAVGLITAIVASIVCALFGGTPLGVSGPAAAMAVLIASVVQQFGLAGLMIVGLGCGLLQLLMGIFGMGKIVRFVPLPVVAGFTAGIGAIILIGQLPRALGLPAPDQSHVFDVITHIWDLIHQTRFSALGLALSTLSITFILPRFAPKLPSPLIAVLVPSIVVAFLDVNVETIGNIPNSLPFPKLPTFIGGDFVRLLGSTFVVFSLASLETLLSSSAVDKISKTQRHDPDQELIGQGLGNIVSSLFGGIPVTGVIARSALNVQSGAKSRRAAIIHALVLIATVYFLAPLVSKIPTAVLAGTLLSVALRMLHPREFIQVWRSSRFEAAIYLITFFVIIFVDLIAGVQAGVVSALVIAAIRLGQARTDFRILGPQGPSHISFEGPITFLSSSKVEAVRTQLAGIDPEKGIFIDFSGVTNMDASGGSQLVELLEQLIREKIKFDFKGLTHEYSKMLSSLDHHGKLKPYLRLDSGFLPTPTTSEENLKGMDRLIYGVEKFKRELRLGYENLFEKLAEGQSPHTLFITCSDSRINPNLITSTDPGELFIIRNVGNLVPVFGEDHTPAEGAAVEYAISVLGVKEIVVCGHSGCGAMAAILSESTFSQEGRKAMPSVAKWLEVARGIKNQLPPHGSKDQAAGLNALQQIENLKTYPIIQAKLAKGEIRLHAWYYNIGKSELDEWDDIQKKFVTVGSKAFRSLEKRMEAGVQFQAPILKSGQD